MISRCVIAALFFTALAIAPSEGLSRKWSDVTGRYSVEAEFVELKDSSVVLRKEGGEVVEVPLSRLSQADRDYVTSRREPSATLLVPSKPPESRILDPRREPICGQPSVDSRTLIERLKNTEKKQIDAWRDALAGVGIIGGQEFATAFPKLSFLFDGNTLNERRNWQSLERLRSLDETEVNCWRDAFVRGPKVIVGGRNWQLPVTLTAVDKFFDGTKYKKEVAREYAKRVEGLSKSRLTTWMEKHRPSGDRDYVDAAISIVLTEN